METVDIYSLKNNPSASQEGLLLKAFHANGFILRLRGLLGRPQLQDNEGLLLTPCAQVHTLGMRYPLDIIFLDKTGKVTKCVSGLKPNRFAASTQAHHVLELNSGSIEYNGIKAGDQLNWKGLDRP